MARRKTVKRALIGFGPALAAAAIGGVASADAKTVYSQLDKPDWAPPAEVFGPVWSGLYALIGYAGFRMTTLNLPRRIWLLHWLQLALNSSWSWAFFRARKKPVSLAVIGAINMVLAMELIALWRRDRKTAIALLPYSAWVAFAGALNLSVEDLEEASD